MNVRSAIVIMTMLVIYSCSQDKVYIDTPIDQLLTQTLNKAAKTGEAAYFLLPSNQDLSVIPQDSHNPLTEEKVKLGKMLFFETGLALSSTKESGHKTYSCASCHVPSAGFRPGSAQGIADGGVGFGRNGENRSKIDAYREWELDVQGVRPLSVLNVAYVENTTWNGRFGGGGVNSNTSHRWSEENGTELNHDGLSALETQNIEGLTLHRMEITNEVLDDYGYRAYFDDAFGDFPEEERYSKVTASYAISAYLRTLLTDEAPFQNYLKGDKKALTDQEKKGALLFFGKAKCYHCHREKNLGANDFYAIGVKDLYETGQAFDTSAEDEQNLGRGEFTGRAEDDYKFKIPQLYNLGDAPFYFHGSSFTDLREVVEYFNNGIPENNNVPPQQIARQFKPLGLTQEEVDDLTSFLENGLQDPDLNRYVPEEVLSGFCFPNNDVFSRIELGCRD